MKIVYLHQYFNTLSASGSTRSYEFARRLAKMGHDVQIVSTVRGPEEEFHGWRRTEVDGIVVHLTHVPYGNDLRIKQRLQAFIKFALRASLKARSLQGDVIFASSTPLTIAIPAGVASWGRKIPIVFEVRDLWPEVPLAMGALRRAPLRWLAFLLQRFAYKQARHIVALSPDMKAGIVKAGYPASQVSVIPNSADIELFRVPESEGSVFRQGVEWLRDRPLILYCGTLGRVNNATYIVKLAEEAIHSRPEYRFLIVGDGSEREGIIRAARAAEVLDKNLFIWNPLPKSQLAPIYSATTVTLSTVAPIQALWANSANKVFDSFAAGRPIAINHGGWQASLLEKTGAGVVLDSTDYATAMRRLAALVDDDEAVCRAREAASRLATEQFARDLHADQLATVLDRAARGRWSEPS